MKHWFILGKICMKGQEMLILFFFGGGGKIQKAEFVYKIKKCILKNVVLCLILGEVLV